MSYYIIGLLLSLMSWACSDDVETGREEIPVETDGGYLFAHMTNANYGKLYYAASRDCFRHIVHKDKKQLLLMYSNNEERYLPTSPVFQTSNHPNAG